MTVVQVLSKQTKKCTLSVPVPAHFVNIPECVYIPYSRTFSSVFVEVILYARMSYCMVLNKVFMKIIFY